MKIKDVPYGHFFKTHWGQTFKKGCVATEAKGKDYIGDGEYFVRCPQYEYTETGFWEWIGSEVEVEHIGEYLFI